MKKEGRGEIVKQTLEFKEYFFKSVGEKPTRQFQLSFWDVLQKSIEISFHSLEN